MRVASLVEAFVSLARQSSSLQMGLSMPATTLGLAEADSRKQAIVKIAASLSGGGDDDPNPLLSSATMAQPIRSLPDQNSCNIDSVLSADELLVCIFCSGVLSWPDLRILSLVSRHTKILLSHIRSESVD